MAEDRDAALRATVFARLEHLVASSPHGTVRSAEVNELEFEGRRFQVIGQQGIRRVAGLEAALGFTTAFRPPGRERPYEDGIGPDGLLRYKYRGTDPEHPDNRALRRAMELGRPLVYFFGVAPGVYQPIFPVHLVAENREAHEFSVAVDEAQRLVPAVAELTPPQREWVLQLTKRRLHQRAFRTQVLLAYDSTCAMCRLRHPELLDAAHIIEDGKERGDPVVPNGLSLCKIHHAAYDQYIVGVRPDLVVEVREDVLHEVDGPMLRHGLQALEGQRLLVPRSRSLRPDPDRLDERYAEFRRAG